MQDGFFNGIWNGKSFSPFSSFPSLPCLGVPADHHHAGDATWQVMVAPGQLIHSRDTTNYQLCPGEWVCPCRVGGGDGTRVGCGEGGGEEGGVAKRRRVGVKTWNRQAMSIAYFLFVVFCAVSNQSIYQTIYLFSKSWVCTE